ncbi:S41 family peptidase [candidate division KSB1 bacterium]|nr:S41 family peptidase [candidate division KSB1 bacterium]
MSKRKQVTSYTLVAVLTVVAVVSGGWIARQADAAKPDYYLAISRSMSTFGKVYEEVTKRYVEDVDPEKFMQAGIEGMLNTLDPYTVFIEKEDKSELQIMTSGKYGGVGMRISKRDGWPTVAEPPFENTPSEKAGIREGDRIIEVDSMVTKDLSISETANRLRGKPGTPVQIKIKRIGEDKPLEFRLIRAEIKVEEITYSGLINPEVGYIRLAHFSRNVGEQMNREISELKAKGMKKLILDLRGNPGGLLESAVEVADNFFPKGTLVVSTKGKFASANREYDARRDPVWGTEPLVVLVDTMSASASEIVAGAIQDHDRGVIIGNPTFGKGLVQSVVQISNDAALKITTAKYYIPSGRLIQKPNFYNDPNVLLTEALVDSTKIYTTEDGRPVHGSGGIYPDVTVEKKTLSPIVIEMIMKSMFFNFSLEYTAKHPNISRNFEVDDTILNAYKAFLKEKKFQYKTEEEDYLQKIEALSKENGYADKAAPAFAELQKVIDKKKDSDFEASVDDIKIYIKSEIAAKLFGTAAKVEATFNRNPAIQKALEVLSDDNQYATILHTKSK